MRSRSILIIPQVHFPVVIQDTALPVGKNLKAKNLPFCAIKNSLKRASFLPRSLQSQSTYWGQNNWLCEALGGHRWTGGNPCSPGASSHVWETEPSQPQEHTLPWVLLQRRLGNSAPRGEEGAVSVQEPRVCTEKTRSSRLLNGTQSPNREGQFFNNWWRLCVMIARRCRVGNGKWLPTVRLMQLCYNKASS